MNQSALDKYYIHQARTGEAKKRLIQPSNPIIPQTHTQPVISKVKKRTSGKNASKKRKTTKKSIKRHKKRARDIFDK